MSADASVRDGIRRAARDALSAMTPEARESASQTICDHLLDLDAMHDGGVVMLYWPLVRADGSAEPDVRPVVERLLARDARVCLPRTDWAAGTMEAVRIRSTTELVAARFGLREPSGSEVVAPSALTVVVAPGVAFDPAGNRLGHGRGFYDRFLGRAGASPVRVGVGFVASVVDAIPASGEDVPMQVLVTEAGVTIPG